MMELNLYAQVGILLGFATLISLLMRFLRQPLIIGHIITGFLAGRFALELFHATETLKLFSELGISFLLFSVGLTLNPKVLKEYGIVSMIAGFSQVGLTGTAGWFVCRLLGYDAITSLYVGIALAFSSTVIVMKLLSDKGDLDKLYVKLSIGSLIIQDLIAIVLLFAIPFVTGAKGTGSDLLRTMLFGAFAMLGVYLFTQHILKHLHPYLTRSQELLFLFAISWGMGVSALFAALGFSLEGGALIAGIALSTLPSRHEIGARLAPLKDFFIVAFFITLGTTMVVSNFQAILVPAAILSLFVLIGNPLLQLIIMGWMGYRKKTSFQTGMMAAQISEFSLILVALGVTLRQVDKSVLSMVTLIGIITIFISSYLILYSDTIYKYVARYLSIFERKHTKEKRIPNSNIPVILIGGSRIGYDFIELFTKEEKKFVVLDHDPDVLSVLAKSGVATEYGDANDPELLEELKINQAELVVSTAPHLETNLLLLSIAKRNDNGPYVIVVAHQIKHAIELYEAGADYVILPHFLGGTYAAKLVKKFTHDALELQDIRASHIKSLQSRLAKGHEHPEFDRK
jgi:Kef-type K+ transport system membrane component KefB/Trk K+ transport system NAD-binding subunit